MTNGAGKIVDTKHPKLSLIVATTGRADELRRLLTSLVDQLWTNFEVVVVDQSHDMAPIGALVDEFSRKLQIIYLQDGGTGLSRARNIGLRHAAGEFLGFPDDDCWYNSGVVESVVEYFQKNPDVGLYSGMYTEPGRTNPTFPVKPCALSRNNLFDKTCSVGLFIRRGGVGGVPLIFDEHIGAGTSIPAGEEVDLALRLLTGGVRGFYDPSLVIFHPINRENNSSKESYVSLRMAFWYVIGKNYRPFFSEAKLIRGIAGCIFKRSSYSFIVELSAVINGFREGLRFRSRYSIETSGD